MAASDNKKADELVDHVDILMEREKMIAMREGYSYQLMKMHWEAGGPMLGLGVKHFDNRVLVSECKVGSISSIYLKLGDHIVDIDDQLVTDKYAARDIIVKNLQARGEVTMVVERPETMEDKHWVANALQTLVPEPTESEI